MKKLIILAVTLALCTSVSAQNGWRIGVTAGSFGNRSSFSGGTTNASALFTHQKYHTGMWGILFRKQINDHLSFQTGLNFSSLGFENTMSRDYSLLNPHSHYMMNHVGVRLGSIPATLIWNFNPNCKNVRWFVGGGLSLVGHGANTNNTKNVEPSQSETSAIGVNSTDYINQNVLANPFTVLNGHIMFGVEKLFKRGTMLSLAFYFNRGFTPVATSTVNYSVNGQLYSHNFTNYNNYSGVTLSYYFKTFKGKAALRVK